MSGSPRQAMRWATASLVLMICGLTASDVESATRPVRPSVVVGDVVTLTGRDRQDEFPAIAVDADGKPWVAWVSWDGRNDAVMARRVDGAGTSQAVTLSDGAGDCWAPAMCTDGDGRLWVAWSQNDKGDWNIYAKYRSAGAWSPAMCLTDRRGNDFYHQLPVDRAGRAWMVWQAVAEGNYEIMLARVTTQGLRDVQNVSRHPANDWEPDVAAAGDGRLFIGWDRYRNGSYDVLVCELKDGKLGEPMAVAASPNYEAHAALAVDRRNRLWVAWDDGGPRWGHYAKPNRKLHSQRKLGLRCLIGDQMFAPKEDLATVLTGELSRFCELPELVVDGTGRLWLILRHLTDLTPRKPRKGGQPQQARGIWNPHAACYAGGRWSEPVKLRQSNGRNDMRVATCVDRTGQVWAAWADDGRSPERSYEPVNHNVHVAKLGGATQDEVDLAVVPLDGRAARVADRPSQPSKRHTFTVGGATYTLFFGDLHRHTDISRCAMNYDGSLLDTYRYAIDVARLDFLGITDHDQDILKHRHHRKPIRLRDYAWWRSQKYCDLFVIDDVFLPFYAYEHGGSTKQRGGHQNVVYPKRGFTCFEQDAPAELFKLVDGTGAVVIPHQLADGGSATDWSQVDTAYEPVAEIYQARGSYEYLNAAPKVRVSRPGTYLQDALGKGIRIGVIASSDHGLISGAYAGVYAEAFSRESILNGLRARRTFGATDKIVVEFRLGEKLLGQEIEIEGRPAFNVRVRGTEVLKCVQVVKDGKSVYTVRPDSRESRFDYADWELAAGDSSYYYVRCEQQPSAWAWSSAIWVKRAK